MKSLAQHIRRYSAQRFGQRLAAILLALALAGCQLAEVKPWERDVLARDAMQSVPDPVEEYFDGHIHASREGAFGGKGIGGGGCGCN